MEDKVQKSKKHREYKNIISRNKKRNDFNNLLSENENLLNSKSSYFKSLSGGDTTRKHNINDINVIKEDEKSVNFASSINMDNEQKVLSNSFRENPILHSENIFEKKLPPIKPQPIRIKVNNTESSKHIK